VNEKEIEEMERTWHSMNRDSLRQKFVERHEKNIQVEERAGIKKEYKDVHETYNSKFR